MTQLARWHNIMLSGQSVSAYDHDWWITYTSGGMMVDAE